MYLHLIYLNPISMKILHLDVSPRFGESLTRKLSQTTVDRLVSLADGKAEVIRRDLVTSKLPFVDGQMIEAYFTSPSDLSDAHQAAIKVSNELTQELVAADVVVVGVPMWNFGVPASFKAWIDLVARVGVTFKYGATGPEGLLTGKKVYINIATGGTPIGSGYDHLKGHLSTFFGFLGITDQEFIVADGVTGQNADEKFDAAKAKANELAAV